MRNTLMLIIAFVLAIVIGGCAATPTALPAEPVESEAYADCDYDAQQAAATSQPDVYPAQECEPQQDTVPPLAQGANLASETLASSHEQEPVPQTSPQTPTGGVLPEEPTALHPPGGELLDVPDADVGAFQRISDWQQATIFYDMGLIDDVGSVLDEDGNFIMEMLPDFLREYFAP